MNINYEALFWVMFFVNVVSLIYIFRLTSIVNDLSITLGVKSKLIRDAIDEMSKRFNLAITDLTIDLRDHDVDMTTKLNLLEADVGEIADELLGPIVVGEGDEEEVKVEEIKVEIDELPIHLITPNQYFFEKGHDKFDLEYDSVFDELRFYFGVCDEIKHIVIDNVEECVGDALKFFGLNSKNDSVVYVRNNVFGADFMITKVVED